MSDDYTDADRDEFDEYEDEDEQVDLEGKITGFSKVFDSNEDLKEIAILEVSKPVYIEGYGDISSFLMFPVGPMAFKLGGEYGVTGDVFPIEHFDSYKLLDKKEVTMVVEFSVFTTTEDI